MMDHRHAGKAPQAKMIGGSEKPKTNGELLDAFVHTVFFGNEKHKITCKDPQGILKVYHVVRFCLRWSQMGAGLMVICHGRKVIHHLRNKGLIAKSSILIGLSLIFTIHFGVPLFLETPIYRSCHFFLLRSLRSQVRGERQPWPSGLPR